MRGHLTPDHAAHIDLEISEAVIHDFIIDTGFSDFLYLPEDLILHLDLAFVGTIPIRLADGSIRIADVFETTVLWFGRSQDVIVTAGPVDCDSLLGMKLLEGCRIELTSPNKKFE